MFLLQIVAALDLINGDLFDELFTQHKDRVYAIARGYVDTKEDAEDVVQEVFIKVYRNIDIFHDLEREEIIAWIVICTQNTAIDHIRKQKRRIKAFSLNYDDENGDEKEYEIPDTDSIPEDVIVTKEIARRLGEYIDQIPDVQRHIIIYKYYYHMKNKAIAKVFGISETAVSSRLNRAKEKLRTLIGGEL